MKRMLSTCFPGTLALAMVLAGCGGSDGDEDMLDSGVSDAADGADNRPPVAVDDTASTREREPVDIWVVINDSDPDDDELIVTEVVQPENGFVEILQGNERLRYTAVADFVGIDQFTYIVSDQRGGADEGKVTINVEEIPVLTLVITSPVEDEVVSGTEVQVTFEVTGCTVSSPQQDRNGCHLHKFLDGVGNTGGSGGIGHYVPTPLTITELTEGAHEITLELISNDGSDQPVNPYVADSVNITVTP